MAGLDSRCMGQRMQIDTEVLIVGAGPVGLTLAIDLARRGVQVTVAEMRARGEPPSVRCNVVSARSMEMFRALGLARAVREAGLPADYPNDVALRTSATGFELARIPIPCRAQRYVARNGPDTWWPTPEPPHRINQLYLDPVLSAAAARTPGVRLLFHTQVCDFVQRPDGVLAMALDRGSNGAAEIFARYLVGCDGAHSEVRRRLGVALSGEAALLQAQSSYIRAPGLLKMMPGPAWAIDCITPRSRGVMFAIDGAELWVVHKFAELGQCLAGDREQTVRDVLGVTASYPLQILRQEDWIGRRLIADRFRVGRVFLCGDAAHIWMPFAAYGMNAGIADATNLSWMLAGVVKGWGSPALLDAYEAERRPITEQVSRHAMKIGATWMKRYGRVPEQVEQPGPLGDAVRQRVGREVYQMAVKGYCCGGLNFGYYYEDSPIIAYDGEAAPAYGLYDFRQAPVPGCRTPHLWLRDGRSLYDALGADFTLLRFDPTVDAARLSAAAKHCGVPLKVLDVDAEQAAELYPCKLLLSRPDRHVAWRGDRQPQDPTAVIERVCGAVSGTDSHG
jgi:2-polyprenyl-6-methoxyphenol hydroxylase-like FAD-dependent oxidoreductase